MALDDPFDVPVPASSIPLPNDTRPLSHPTLTRIRNLLFAKDDLLSPYDKLLIIFRLSIVVRNDLKGTGIESVELLVQPRPTANLHEYLVLIQSYLGIRELPFDAQMLLIFDRLETLFLQALPSRAPEDAPSPHVSSNDVGPPTH